MRFSCAVLALALFATPALAASAYDKSEVTTAYDVRLRVPADAIAIAPLKAQIMARWKTESDALKRQASADLKDTPQYFHQNALDTRWRVSFEDARLISLSANSFVDHGGAHPDSVFDSIIWDKTANRALPLGALFAPGQSKAAFTVLADSARKTWIATVTRNSGAPADVAQANESIAPDEKGLGSPAITYAKGESKANGIVLLYGAGRAWPHVLGDFRLAVPVAVFRKYLAPQWAGSFK